MLKVQPKQKPGLALFFASSNCSMFCFILFGFIIWLLASHPKRPACSNSKQSFFPRDTLDWSTDLQTLCPLGDIKLGQIPFKNNMQTHTDIHIPPSRLDSLCNFEIAAKEQWLSSRIKALPKCKIL